MKTDLNAAVDWLPAMATQTWVSDWRIGGLVVDITHSDGALFVLCAISATVTAPVAVLLPRECPAARAPQEIA